MLAHQTPLTINDTDSAPTFTRLGAPDDVLSAPGTMLDESGAYSALLNVPRYILQTGTGGMGKLKNLAAAAATLALVQFSPVSAAPLATTMRPQAVIRSILAANDASGQQQHGFLRWDWAQNSSGGSLLVERPVPSSSDLHAESGSTEIYAAASVAPHRSNLTDWSFLAQHYRVDDTSTVLTFLESHPQLQAVLMEMPDRAKFFFPDAVILLDTLEDPEEVASEHRTTLLAHILTCLPVEQALASLSRMDDEWWLDHYSDVGDILTILVGHEE